MDKTSTDRDKKGTAWDKTGTAQDKTGTARDKTGTGEKLDKHQVFFKTNYLGEIMDAKKIAFENLTKGMLYSKKKSDEKKLKCICLIFQ